MEKILNDYLEKIEKYLKPLPVGRCRIPQEKDSAFAGPSSIGD